MRVYQIIGYFFFLTVTGFSQEFNIKSFGAIADGTTLNTTAIQKAIDAAYAAGGGRVIIPAGRFLSGSIVMKTGTELYLAEHAVLLGSTNPSDYIKINRWKALVMADRQHHLSITGKGTIDGQGRQLALHVDSLFYAGKFDSINYNFVEMRPKEPHRPQLVEFVDCHHIDIRGITMRDASCWVQTYERCEVLVMDSVRIISDAYWNNDGIDISDCRNVQITNCFVDTADDGICLKSHAVDHLCDSIYIGHCQVRSSASAIKFGTASYGGFRDVTIEHIKVADTFRSAIAIETVDGGSIENVLVQHIEAKNTGNAIFIRLGKRNQQRPPGSVRNIIIRDMKVEVAFERPDYAYDIRGPELPFFHNVFPSSITGIPGFNVGGVVLQNIEIIYPGRGNNGLANRPLSRLHQIPEKESAYPEFSMFGELPAWGLYVRHVRGITLDNVRMSIREADYRPAIVFDDVSEIVLTKLEVLGDTKPSHLILSKVANVHSESWEGIQRL